VVTIAKKNKLAQKPQAVVLDPNPSGSPLRPALVAVAMVRALLLPPPVMAHWVTAVTHHLPLPTAPVVLHLAVPTSATPAMDEMAPLVHNCMSNTPA
jgi:hypothetical protein